MQFTEILNYLLDGESEEAKLELLNAFQKRTLKESQLLLNFGEICTAISYLEEGIVREFRYLTETETETETETFWLLAEGNWLYAIDSFVNGTPSKTALQALSTSTFYTIEKATLNNILKRYPTL